MKRKRTKVSFSQMNKEIAPYINKSWFGRESIDEDQIAAVAELLLSKYDNIDISQGVHSGSGKRWLKIRVSGTFSSKEKELIVLRRHGRKPVKRKADQMDDLFEYWSAVDE